MEMALENIKILEVLYKRGYGDEFLDKALNKIIFYEVSESRKHLEVLQKDLMELEKKYGFSTKAFTEKFQKGQLGDDADFIEWNALYKMYGKLKHRLDILKG